MSLNRKNVEIFRRNVFKQTGLDYCYRVISFYRASSCLVYRRIILIYTILSFLYVILLTINASVLPGDISNGRQSFKEGKPSDFFGTFAGLMYSVMPEWPFGWARNLTLLQVLIAQIGLILLVRIKESFGSISLWVLLIVQYFVAIFSSQQSRDGALLALLILGFGLIRYSRDTSHPKWIFISFGTFFLISGLAFRPALSLSAVIFLIFLKYVMGEINTGAIKRWILFTISGLLIVLPTSIELGFTRILVKQSEYPIQTVILQDLGFAACQSASPRTINRSIEAFSVLANDKDFNTRLCQFYRIYTWQSLPGFIAPSSTTSDLKSPIRLAESSSEFNTLLEGWLSVIALDPKTYLQGKLVSLTQVLFSSQTKIWTPASGHLSSNLNEKIVNLAKWLGFSLNVPWIVLSELYLLSPIGILFSFLIFNRFLKRTLKLSLPKLILIPLFLLSAIASNAVFFVSDNARYASSFSILVFVAYALVLFRKETLT